MNRVWPYIGLLLATLATDAMADQRFGLAVDGLACPFCAYGLEKRLGDIPGVTGVAIELEAGRAIVTTADDRPLTEATARAAVRDAGFTLRGFASLP